MKKTISRLVLVAIFILFATSDAFSYQEERDRPECPSPTKCYPPYFE